MVWQETRTALRNDFSGGIVGGEDRIDTDREYLTGDNFIVNFGTAEWKTVSQSRLSLGRRTRVADVMPRSTIAGVPTTGRYRVAYR